MIVNAKVCYVKGCSKKPRSNNGPCEMHYYRKRRNGSYSLKPVESHRKIEFNINANNCFEVSSHAKQTNGYFMIMRNGVRKSMHRFIYEECFGEIPNGLYVLHKCDNKECINPEHLELGDAKKNALDAVGRLGMHLGSSHPLAKLDEGKVKRIRYLLNVKKARNTDVAKKFNVDPTTISDIKLRKTWKHIKDEIYV